MNANYRKGADRERRTVALLEAAGYTAGRSAGSHGKIDVFAFDANGFRLIQCKSGDANVTPKDREALKGMARPHNATVEVWRWPDRTREPLIERIA